MERVAVIEVCSRIEHVRMKAAGLAERERGRDC